MKSRKRKLILGILIGIAIISVSLIAILGSDGRLSASDMARKIAVGNSEETVHTALGAPDEILPQMFEREMWIYRGRHEETVLSIVFADRLVQRIEVSELNPSIFERVRSWLGMEERRAVK